MPFRRPAEIAAERRSHRRRGTVISFVPQIVLLFMFLAILEDTGYLAGGIPDGQTPGPRRIARQELYSIAEQFRLRNPRHHGDCAPSKIAGIAWRRS